MTKTAVLVQNPEYKQEDMWPLALFEDYDKAIGSMIRNMQEELHSKYPDAEVSCSGLVLCGEHDDGNYDGVKLTMTARVDYKEVAVRVGYVFDMEVQE